LIKDQKTFDMYFNPAVVMGKSTTTIDFEKNLVYAYLSPVTSNEVKLICERAYIKDKVIQIKFKKTVGPTNTFSIKPVLIVAVSEKAREQGLKAGALVKIGSTILGGGGGGKADVAQGGGVDASKSSLALSAIEDSIAGK
jgi:alanyl-tRNA synthetase